MSICEIREKAIPPSLLNFKNNLACYPMNSGRVLCMHSIQLNEFLFQMFDL